MLACMLEFAFRDRQLLCGKLSGLTVTVSTESTSLSLYTETLKELSCAFISTINSGAQQKPCVLTELRTNIEDNVARAVTNSFHE